MSAQLTFGKGRGKGGAGGGGGGAGRFNSNNRNRGFNQAPKAYKSSVSEIADDTFNVGLNKYAAQFGTSRRNVANYLQKTLHDEGYLAAQAVRTGKKQSIPMPPPADLDDADAVRIRNVLVDAAGRRIGKLDAATKRGFAIVYDQCSPGVRDKLEASENWSSIETEQSLQGLINAIERVCVGFDDHKQTMYNIVQSTKKLYLHMQDEKTTVPDYSRDFKSLWETCESFGGTPGYHQGPVNQLLKDTSRVADVNRPTDTERKAAVNDTAEAVKGSLLLSGADQKRFGMLKKELHNDYLKGTDNYPYTLDRAVRLLENYEGPKQTWRPPVSPGGELAFVQQGAVGRGRGKKAAAGAAGQKTKASSGDDGATSASGGGTAAAGAPRTNRHGHSHCYHCGKDGHYAAECPDLTAEQQEQLHMSLGEVDEEEGGGNEEGSVLMNVCMAQRGGLPDDRVYLDNCSTVTGFKDSGRIQGISEVSNGMRVNCNAGQVVSNKVGSWGKLKAWHLSGSIANIISMNELEEHYRVTYDSWDGKYVVHTEHGPVYFVKDEQGLPYIDLEEGDKRAQECFFSRPFAATTNKASPRGR